MTSRDDDRPSDDTTAPTERRPGQRRARIAAGVAGLAAVLGGGAYLTTSAIMTNKSTDVTELADRGALSSNSSPGQSAAASSSADASPSPIPSADISGTPLPSKVTDQIKKAREKMAKDGVKVDRPVPQKATAAGGAVKRTTEGSLQEGGIIRLVTARRDLAGQEELAYVAGGVQKYRNVPCSQTFQFSTNPKPVRKNNLLACWLTSPTKSVIVMVVDPKGHPSRDKAVDAIDKSWRSLG
jgi:hypothetical protein